MIKRIAATIAGTLVLWLAWWGLGAGIALSLIDAPPLLGDVVVLLWWAGIVAIPPLLWFRFRHVL